MPTETDKKKTKTLNGLKRGGAKFLRINLKEALTYSKKLVSKTFSAPLPEATILVGVFNNKGSVGKIRASALKQYGLMGGDNTDGYFASDSAKKIETAMPEQLIDLLKSAFLTPKVFKQMYDTVQSEKVSSAKVRQAAANCGVHPENLNDCVDCFIESAAHAGLGTKTNDGIDLSKATVPEALPPAAVLEEDDDDDADQESAQDIIKTQESNADSEPGGGDIAVQSKSKLLRSDKPIVNLSLQLIPLAIQRNLKSSLSCFASLEFFNAEGSHGGGETSSLRHFSSISLILYDLICWRREWDSNPR